ncbi:MAG: hypothetical protein LQ348_003912 [Seirophora lacunosa]|nr:MAG: hypothetical protein LQ348_003912 [Seirophora lacunosa]
MNPAGQARNIEGCSENILSTTFAQARLLLRKLLKPEDYDTLFPPATGTPNPQRVSSHTIFDVHRCLKDAQASYEDRTGQVDPLQTPVAPTSTVPTSSSNTTTVQTKSGSKTRLWLTGLSEKLLYYSNIFDVLAQHHPEYVALAWGTLKFLFIAVINHATTVSKLGTSISQIADLLPQHSLHVILYPTSEMQNAVARLYACILRFFLSALQWYNDSRAAHALKSIFQPWDIRFRSEHEAVAAAAQQVERLANAALKAEVRVTRLEVVRGREDWEVMRREMGELRDDNRRLQELWKGSFQGLEGSILGMYKEIRVDLASQRSTLGRVHLNQMLTLPLWGSLPTSGESLGFCRSMRKRRRERLRLPLPDVQKLKTWSTRDSNAILLIDTYNALVAKTFMIDLVDLILDSRLPIIWALRFPNYWDQPMGAVDIARTLVLQAMQLGADRLLNSPFPVTVEQLRDAASFGEWIAILNRLLSGTTNAFMVLDADLLAHATTHERSQALEMLDLLRTELSANVKIVTATSCVSRGYVEELEASDACIRLHTGGAADWRAPRRSRRPVARSRKR